MIDRIADDFLSIYEVLPPRASIACHLGEGEGGGEYAAFFIAQRVGSRQRAKCRHRSPSAAAPHRATIRRVPAFRLPHGAPGGLIHPTTNKIKNIFIQRPAQKVFWKFLETCATIDRAQSSRKNIKYRTECLIVDNPLSAQTAPFLFASLHHVYRGRFRFSGCFGGISAGWLDGNIFHPTVQPLSMSSLVCFAWFWDRSGGRILSSPVGIGELPWVKSPSSLIYSIYEFTGFLTPPAHA